MKILCDDKVVYEVTDHIKNVICNDIPDDLFYDDMIRRLRYVLEHKYEMCMKRLIEEWMPKLREKGLAIPPKDEDFVALIMSQPEYKNRSEREKQ